jgi:hypothetical protein
LRRGEKAVSISSEQVYVEIVWQAGRLSIEASALADMLTAHVSVTPRV